MATPSVSTVVETVDDAKGDANSVRGDAKTIAFLEKIRIDVHAISFELNKVAKGVIEVSAEGVMTLKKIKEVLDQLVELNESTWDIQKRLMRIDIAREWGWNFAQPTKIRSAADLVNFVTPKEDPKEYVVGPKDYLETPASPSPEEIVSVPEIPQ